MELIGKFAFNNHYFDRAYEWLTNALNKASKNAEQASTSKIISRIESELQTVIKYHDNILELKGSPRGPTWRTYLARKNKYKRAALQHNNGSRYYKLKPKLLVPLKEHEIGDQFAALCRAKKSFELLRSAFEDPYLRLGPFQYEALHSRPNIGMIHSFLTEGEADTLISESTSRSMARSQHSGRKSENEFSFKRTSKQVWLNEESLSSNRVISKRLELASRFELSQGGSEDYQIVNYGLGGTYKPHFDSFDNEGLSKEGGDRLATALVYLSDVEAGGSTVFPLLGLQIPPSKGALVMWYETWQT
ncbi:Prolyl4hydroxylasealpha SG1 [Caligus rogercresseyi]|uniref:Prolyl4hydroxylasealpha SG1 n=1 Tax=Caligus rogercresseyi TaxID=217165 RepID=A0A7T8JWW9_CALRO|nr:Prolyl4hydroxylasealpha SG1 [Caligus rogercresseyi]